MSIFAIELTEQWFRENAAVDPSEAWRRWKRWHDRHRDFSARTKWMKVLEMATGKTRVTIQNYVQGRENRFSEMTRRQMDTVTLALGLPIPKPTMMRKMARVPLRRSARRIAILCQLADLPNPAFHLELIRSIIREARKHLFEVSLHEVAHGRITEAIESVLRVFTPDAVILLRLTPDQNALGPLTNAEIPAVLIHAHRCRYPSPPVLAHIVPSQGGIVEGIRMWASDLAASTRARGGRPPASRTIVLVRMERETGEPPFDPTATHFSIRNERIALLLQGLHMAEVKVVEEEVKDYSFRHAVEILRKHPAAIGYACLSDELAVALRHLLRVSGRRDAGVIGFDHSRLAQEERIWSFGQDLSAQGSRAIETLLAWWNLSLPEGAAWPAFCELASDVDLKAPSSPNEAGDLRGL